MILRTPNAKTLLTLLALTILIGAAVATPNPGHDANSIGGGTIDGNITINGTLAVTTNTNYAASIHNTGNTSNAHGIRIRAGASNGSGNTHYLTAEDGDGSIIGYLAQNASSFQLYTVSDERLKTNIRPTGMSATEAITGLAVKDYEYRQSAGTHTGFIAQEVSKAIPQAVAQSPDGNLAVSYTAMVPYLVKAVQEQQALLDNITQHVGHPETNDQLRLLAQTVEELAAENARLHTRLAALEERVYSSEETTTITLDQENIVEVIP